MDPTSNSTFNEIPGGLNECYILNITTTNGIWQGENPLTESLPHFITQFTVILIVTRLLFFLFRPLNQSRIVTDILGGILLGPSAFGKTIYFVELFPTKNIMTLETLAYLALVFHMFLVGLELDVNAIMRTGKKAASFSFASLFVSFFTGIGLFYFLHLIWGHNLSQADQASAAGSFLWATALTVTGFPEVAQILSDLKLLHTDIGRLAMSSALLSDMSSWVLTGIALPVCAGPKNAPFVITSAVAFILMCAYVLRPFLAWVIHHTTVSNNSQYSDHYLCFVLVGVVLCAFLTDVTGTHSVAGAFVFGLIMPSTELGDVLLDRFDYFVSGLLMPLFFATCGIRVDIFKVKKWWLVLFVMSLLCGVKILVALLISLLSNTRLKDGLALGLLMSAKGVLAILVLNTGWDKKVLHDDDYTVMVLAALVMTSLISPSIASIYKRSKSCVQYKRRTIQAASANAEFRILACIHSVHNVPGVIQLLDISCATKRKPISVFVLHLVELTGCASAMLIVHNTRRSGGSVHSSKHGVEDPSESIQIVNALGEYESQKPHIAIHPLTAVSSLATMHEDICSLAEDKQTAFLILPFHKHIIQKGDLEDRDIILAFRSINQNVLANAPCSFGIFIDRGFGTPKGSDSKGGMHHIAVVYLGGPDDREALAYAWRMVGHPNVSLTLLRFIPEEEVFDETEPDLGAPSNMPSLLISSRSYAERQRKIDDEYVNEFRLRNAGKLNVDYKEKIVKNDEDLIETLKEVEDKYELYIVGRGEGMVSSLTVRILDWSDCPELGPIGDLLVTSTSCLGSVLVVQQYVGWEGEQLGAAELANALSFSAHGKESELGKWRMSAEGSTRNARIMGTSVSTHKYASFAKHHRRENDEEFETI